jgi:lipopolysaccharide transport system permease protein
VVIRFIMQLGLYVSPVGFTSIIVPAKWRLLYSLNPMVGVIDGFRWCILAGQSPLYVPGLLASLAVVAFCVVRRASVSKDREELCRFDMR